MSVRPRANARSSHRKAPEGPGSCHPLSSCVPCARGRAKDGALRLGWSREGGEGGSLHRGTSTAFRAKSYEWGASGARGAAPWGRRRTHWARDTRDTASLARPLLQPAARPAQSQRPRPREQTEALPLRPSLPAGHRPRPGTARCSAAGDPAVGELRTPWSTLGSTPTPI